MVGGFFPAPYPDECYYSILCRYYVRSGSMGYRRTALELFGNMQCLSTSVFFPIRLERIKLWVPESTGITAESIAVNHTMYPYMIVACDAEFRNEMKRVISGKKQKLNIGFKGTQKSFDLWPEFLRYCPGCAREDIAEYGETYWHRSHQLPGAVYCKKHLIRLVNSRVRMSETSTRFIAASNAIDPENMGCDIQDEFAQYKGKFLKVSEESEWLLKHGMHADWNFDFQTKYKRLLRDMGIATIQAVADYEMIVRWFNEYWGDGFLKALYSTMPGTRNWIRQIQAAQLMTFRPIYHILLTCFLKGSVKGFLESEPPENPFGEGPWPCENPICKHYRTDGCDNPEIKYVNGVATGFFHCSGCRTIYKRVKRKGRTGGVIIVDYGEIWKNELIRCVSAAEMSNQETAEILKCHPNVVKWQRKKLGLTRKEMYGEPKDAEFFKAQVLKVREQHSEATFSMLRQFAPGAYSYLSKRDPEWLRGHLIHESERAGNLAIDRQLLEQVKIAVEWIKKNGDERRRITCGYIARVAGVREEVLRYTSLKRPQTKVFLDTVLESKEDWLRRRITMIWQNQKETGRSLSFADVKRELSIKHNTYSMYKILIEELIDELNYNSLRNLKCSLK